MRLRIMVNQEKPNYFTMDNMSVRSIRRWKYDRLFNMSLYNGDIYETLDEMAKPSHDRLKPLRFYGERRCGGVTNIVKPVYKNKGKIISSIHTKDIIRSCGFLYALAYVQKVLETNALLTMNLRQMIAKGCDYDDY